MKAAIIEDNLLHADLLEKYLLEWSNGKNILLAIDKYKNAESFYLNGNQGLVLMCFLLISRCRK